MLGHSQNAKLKATNRIKMKVVAAIVISIICDRSNIRMTLPSEHALYNRLQNCSAQCLVTFIVWYDYYYHRPGVNYHPISLLRTPNGTQSSWSLLYGWLRRKHRSVKWQKWFKVFVKKRYNGFKVRVVFSSLIFVRGNWAYFWIMQKNLSTRPTINIHNIRNTSFLCIFVFIVLTIENFALQLNKTARTIIIHQEIIFCSCVQTTTALLLKAMLNAVSFESCWKYDQSSDECCCCLNI